MTSARYLWASALLSASIGPALAQSDSAAPRVAATASPTASVGGPGAQVTASNGDSSVSLKLSYETSAVPRSTEPGIVRNGASFTTFSLTASAPLDKGEQSQTLFANGGLGKANAIGISAFHFFADWRNPTAAEVDTLSGLCAQMRRKAEEDKGVKREEAQKLECRKSNYTQYAPDLLPAAEAVRRGPTPGGWGLGLSGKLGQNKSTHYDPTALTKSTTQNKPWSLGAFVAYLLPSNEAMVSLALDRRRTYTDKPPVTRCPAASSPAPVECVTGSFAPPTEKSSSVVTLEGRVLLPRDMALSISVARDTTRRVTAVEVPLHLIESAGGALTGGLKLNWDSEDKKTTVGVFVGVPFNVWK